jgi:trimeric autotransporter adhesin
LLATPPAANPFDERVPLARLADPSCHKPSPDFDLWWARTSLRPAPEGRAADVRDSDPADPGQGKGFIVVTRTSWGWRALVALMLLAALAALGGCRWDVGGGGSGPLAPVITAQPVDQSVVQGSDATFNVAARNATGFQWQRSTNAGASFSDIAGATGASFTISATALADNASQFRVRVQGEASSLTSSAATLSVTAGVVPVTITVQPADQSVIVGQDAQFAVTASGTSPSYQWQRELVGGTAFVDLPGETQPTLTRANVAATDNGQRLRVVVSNAAGSINSNAATLIVSTPGATPVFTAQPADQSVTAPNPASFSVVVSGNPSLQWQKSRDGGASFSNEVGAIEAGFTTAATSVADSGTRYRVVATNAAGTTTSAAATLTVSAAAVAPAFGTQPTDQSVIAPNPASFSVVVTGSPTPTLQWQQSSDGGASFGNINGATGASFTTPASSIDDSGTRYRVVASNAAGNATSNAATLSVRAAAAADTWVTNGEVRALARSEDGRTIYLGGDFSQVGPRTGSFVAIDATTGLPSASFPKVDGRVNASVADGQGGWYIGGFFSLVGSTPRDNLAHILADGRVDPNFAPAVNSEVTALAVEGSTVYVGGEFSRIGQVNRAHIAALNAADGAVTPWRPDADNAVLALAVLDNVVYAGGRFNAIGGQPRRFIAALNDTDGQALANWNPGSDGQVRALVASPAEGVVFVGGQFNLIGGQPRASIAAIGVSAGQVSAFNASANGTVEALLEFGSTILVGGQFTAIGGEARNFIAEVSKATALATSWNPSANGTVRAMALLNNGIVFAGGDFTKMGTQDRNRLAAISVFDGSATNWNPDANADVSTIAVSGNTVFAGGRFTSLGGQVRNNLAALSAADGQLTAWNPDVNGTISALAVNGAVVYAGGRFTTIGGQTRSALAAVSATDGTPLAWGPTADGDVFSVAMASSGRSIYVGGRFTRINTSTRRGLAEIHAAIGLPTDGQLTAWNPNANAQVNALAVAGDTVYAGGEFTTIGGVSRGRLAALDAATGANKPAWALVGADSDVLSLAVSGATVYAGGNFAVVGAVGRRFIAALDATTGAVAAGFDPQANNAVTSLAVAGATVYAGGKFSEIGRQARSSIAALRAADGLATDWNPGSALSTVNSVLVVGDSVAVGGRFSSIDGQARSNVAFVAR